MSDIDEFYRIPLTSAEALATLTAVKAVRALLNGGSDSTLVAGILDSVVGRFAEELPEFTLDESERLSASVAIEVIESVERDAPARAAGATEPPFPAGPTRTKLMDAQQQGKAVEIEYYVHSRNEWSRRNVDIKNVYVSGDAWLLSGHCRLRDEFRLFRVENIRSVRVLDEEELADPFADDGSE